ncbi:MAG TPA: glutamate-5-semialdehyde dehydrogenase [Lachnospiraceae bacterium]|nr:glutamate-5-semialdehyde dehydrogenase [Lachnospiraceae bacterium]
MNIKEQAARMKLDSSKMAAQTVESRNAALNAIGEALLQNKAKILEANIADMEAAYSSDTPDSVMKRLKFDEKKLNDVITGIHELINLPDPLFQVQLARQLDDGLKLYRETVPIGVIGVIFEARPDAMVQISSLCIKSGNCAILKGGSEAMRTNKALFDTIYTAAVGAGMPEGCMLQAELRDDINQLLSCHESVDLLIPRGSNSFVQYIMNNTKIPVMGHADGICHIYADRNLDVEKAVRIIVDSKIQYAAACNAVETLLVHKDAVEKLMPALNEAFEENAVILKGTKDIQDVVNCEPADEEDFHTEYLDYIISAKVVDNIDDAIEHVNKYGSHHTDCIITEDNDAAAHFMQLVDSAGVYCNCSTRFADGFRYGFGAEVGISTGKIHARGPVGLEGLVTYKYKLFGDGHIVADYAKGINQFHFKDLM